MAEKQRLGRDVFIALAAIGWADGKLDAEEADAIVRTALEEGLELEEIESIEEATKQPIDVGAIDLERLTKEDRLFVYAVASWMTRLDGTTDAKEIEALDRLAKSLKLPDGPRRGADAIAQEIGLMAEGDRPARYDLPQLRKVIAQRLEVAERRRAAARDQ
jgi:uncharacterized membrane protein YebE (DUF533 family)